MLLAQESDIKPLMFEKHQGKLYFNTAVYALQKDSVIFYRYQSVAIVSYDESAMVNALLQAYKGNVPFSQYRARSIQRVKYALYGTVDITQATACGYSVTTEAELIAALGLNNYRQSQ